VGITITGRELIIRRRYMLVLKKIYIALIAALILIPLSGCAPEVGSPEWCADMKEKPKGRMECK